MASPKDDSGEAFARHAQQDTALAEPSSQGAPESDDDSSPKQKFTSLGKLFVFIVFPLTVGVLGLYMAYLETRRNPEKKLSFDQDFMLPFLVALAMSVVIGFQTGGFTSNKVKPLVSWPRVHRVKKIIRKKKKMATAEKEEDEGGEEQDSAGDKEPEDKKND